MRLCFVVAIALAAAVLPWPAGAVIIGVDTPTYVDWLGAGALNSVGLRIQPGSTYTGAQVPTFTGNASLLSQAMNYPNGVYTIQFNAPAPAAVGVVVGGMFSGLSNVRAVGNAYAADFTLRHDNPADLKTGAGTIGLSTTAANPVTGFRVIAPGGLANPGGYTARAAGILNQFQGFRTMNQSNVNFNEAAVTVADLIPSGQNLNTWGNSYADQVAAANANPNAKLLIVNVPLNAQPDYVTGAARALTQLRPGVQGYVEVSNEPWNALFPAYNDLYQQSLNDPAHSYVDGDGFGRNAERYGIRSVEVMQQVQAVAPSVKGFLSNQGANSWYGLQSINSIVRNFGVGALHQYVGAMGPSDYPGDNLHANPGTVDNLVLLARADLSRQLAYLVDNATLAHVNGLHAIVYEASIMGALTSSGAPASLFDQFLADPRSGALTTQMLTDAAGILNQPGDALMWFSEPGGDYWGGTPDPLAPKTQVELALESFVGNVPEPRWPCLACAAAAVTRRRRAA